jgi:Fe-S cluster biosynthesis and repair protein YggX
MLPELIRVLNELLKSILKSGINAEQFENEFVMVEDKLNKFLEDEKRDETYNPEEKRKILDKLQPYLRKLAEMCAYVGISSVISVYLEKKEIILENNIMSRPEFNKLIVFKIFNPLTRFMINNTKGGEFWSNTIIATINNSYENTFNLIKNNIRSKIPTTPKSKNIIWNDLKVTSMELPIVWTRKYTLLINLKGLAMSKSRRDTVKQIDKEIRFYEKKALEICNVLFNTIDT